ncbi:MAG: sulfatase-like hydrolase/transferase [Desulfobacterales bacterium]|nr:sulfatase-like hydrolase/transferase [Desulfobacterales bacterium]
MSEKWGPFKKRPNILILMTDQEREVRHFPEGWAEKHLPGLTWLKNNGLSFTNAFCSATPCSPSRGILFTGMYQSQTGLWQIGDTLPSGIKTMGNLMAEKGYQVLYKGKWHLSGDFDDVSMNRPSSGEEMVDEDKAMATDWGFPGWTSPDSGTEERDTPIPDAPWNPPRVDESTSLLNTLGGGTINNDNRVINGPLYQDNQESVTGFLKNRQSGDAPFFMVASMVNPHDIWVYPYSAALSGYPVCEINSEIFDDFELPLNYQDTLETKPAAQKNYAQFVYKKEFDTHDRETALNYLKFYAYLQMQSDKLMHDVIQTLEVKNLLDDTIIIHLADHGEMGMSHKMVEKIFNVYQETVNVPVIFSNPLLRREYYGNKPVRSDALIGLVDIMPTLASIAGWTEEELDASGYKLQGADFSAAILEPGASTQSDVLLTFQGNPFAGSGETGHIRAIFDGKYKYGVYFNSPETPDDSNDKAKSIKPDPQYEMYNLEADPNEMENLLFNPTNENLEKAKEMYARLTALLEKNDMAPATWSEIPYYQKW